MQIENLALRHQLAVLQRRTKKRPSLRTADRLQWVILSRVWAQWCMAPCQRKAGNSNLRGSEKGFDCIGVGRAG